MIKSAQSPYVGWEKLHMHFGTEICKSSRHCKVLMFQNTFVTIAYSEMCQISDKHTQRCLSPLKREHLTDFD